MLTASVTDMIRVYNTLAPFYCCWLLNVNFTTQNTEALKPTLCICRKCYCRNFRDEACSQRCLLLSSQPFSMAFRSYVTDFITVTARMLRLLLAPTNAVRGSVSQCLIYWPVSLSLSLSLSLYYSLCDSISLQLETSGACCHVSAVSRKCRFQPITAPLTLFMSYCCGCAPHAHWSSCNYLQSVQRTHYYCKLSNTQSGSGQVRSGQVKCHRPV